MLKITVLATLLAVGGLALSGCVSLTQQWDIQDDATCRQYGFIPNTEAYANCRLVLSQQRAARQTQSSAAFSAAGAALMMPPTPPRQPLHCTSVQTGVFLNTNCY